MDNIMAGDNEEEEEETTGGSSSQEMNIARRTRSHLRMDDFVPNDNLNFPDVDMNLYRNPDTEVNPDYRQFLNQCYSDEIGNGGDTNTDDNDPEYIYNDDVLSHGWRFDLDEVREFQQDDAVSIDRQQQQNDDLHHHQQERNPSNSFSTTNCYRDSNHNQFIELSSTAKSTISCFKSPSKAGKRKIDMFDDPEFARILNQQLRQHIQLLTQTYLLTRNTTNMRKEADETKCHLNSYMKIFKNKTKPSNLLPALELINNLETPKDLRSSIRLSWRPLSIPESVKETIQKNPQVFIYSSLLPQVAYSFLPAKLAPKKQKVNFTLNEDKLLAYALNEFKSEASPYAFIASLLMTAKTKTQISNHIKNIKRSPCAGNENNPIVAYFNHGTLPEIDLESDSSVGITHLFKTSEYYEEGEPVEEAEEESGKEEREVKSVTVVSNMPFSCENQRQIKVEHGPDVESIDDVEKERKGGLEQKVGCEIGLFESEPTTINLQNGAPSQAPEPTPAPSSELDDIFQQPEDLMNMNLDDLIAASTTISKITMLSNPSENNNNRNIKNLKLKKSMLNLMSHNFLLSDEMSDLIISEFLKTSQQKLDQHQYLQLLQLLTDLMKESKNGGDEKLVHIYKEISKFLKEVHSPPELQERIVLFLNLEQATKCGCSISYLHWMRFFEFMQHLELYHDEVEVLEKKLNRLLDALQKEDNHKVKLAVGNLVDKHPFLKREFDSLSLDEKPHPSLFICEEDFDDITEPINLFTNSECEDRLSYYDYEHFNAKLTEEELSFASQSCPCNCHSSSKTTNVQPNQHCEGCNLKFVKGRMYLVNKIKPILAEWSYTGKQLTPQKTSIEQAYVTVNGGVPPSDSGWTFEDDRNILEFCRSKVEQNEETVSFDTSTFEELIKKRRSNNVLDGICKKSASQIVERFNYLMEIYKDENQNAASQLQ